MRLRWTSCASGCNILEKIRLRLCCTPARDRALHNEEHLIFKNRSGSFKSINFIKEKERLRNCSQLQETEEAWQLMWYRGLDPGLKGKSAIEGHYWNCWRHLNMKIGEMEVLLQRDVSWISYMLWLSNTLSLFLGNRYHGIKALKKKAQCMIPTLARFRKMNTYVFVHIECVCRTR